ncbi:hypothetical protein DSECCO2_468770 [anaerobic digester metagenome]
MGAAVAGSAERPRRELARDDSFCRPDRPDHLPSVPGLRFDEPADAICDVFDVAAGDGLAEGLFQAGDVAGDPEPVGAVGAGAGRGARPGDGERAVLEDLVDPPPDAEGIGLDGKIGLDGPLPGGLAAGVDALIEEFPGILLCIGEDTEDFLPDLFSLKEFAEVRGDLLADGVAGRLFALFRALEVVAPGADVAGDDAGDRDVIVHTHRLREVRLSSLYGGIFCAGARDAAALMPPILAGAGDAVWDQPLCRSGSQMNGMANREISVNIPGDLDPVYSNRIQIAYKEDEFTFLFLHEIPGTNQARAKAIVSISPRHAKNLVEVLAKSVADYEQKFGKISAPEAAPHQEGNVTIRGYS